MNEQAFTDSSENDVRSPYTVLLAWAGFLVLQLSISINTHAQTPPFHWGRQAGGSNRDAGNAVAVDAAGNSYVAGYFSSTDAAFGGFSPTNGGSFVAKYDSTGNLLWAKPGATG